MDSGNTWLKFVNLTYRSLINLLMITYSHDSLVSNPLNIQSDIVKSKRHAFNDIIWVFIEVFQELFDVLVPTLK